MTTNVFVYCSDGLGGQAFDHHSRNGGGAFVNENCPQGWAFDQFFKYPGFSWEFSQGEGMLAAGNDLYITYQEQDDHGWAWSTVVK